MDVRPHLSQHDAAERLPLLSEDATVTAINDLDHSRNDAVLRELRETLDRVGTPAWRRDRPATDEACRRWIRRQLDPIDDGTPLNEYVPDHAAGERGKVAALQERYLRPFPSLLSVTVEPDAPVGFVAGQYVSVRYVDVTRPYSVANAPTDPHLEFCIRRVPGGRFTSTLAESLEVGDAVTLRGPYGDFVMAPPSPRDVVFLATGTGVAPFRSMIDFCVETGRDRYRGAARDIWLFLGCSWEDDLPYREHFRRLDRSLDHFHFVPTLTRERYLTEWRGETAYVQRVLAKYLDEDALGDEALPPELAAFRDDPPCTGIDARIDPGGIEVYACGINEMVHSLVETVKRLGVPPRHTQFEGFG